MEISEKDDSMTQKRADWKENWIDEVNANKKVVANINDGFFSEYFKGKRSQYADY